MGYNGLTTWAALVLMMLAGTGHGEWVGDISGWGDHRWCMPLRTPHVQDSIVQVAETVFGGLCVLEVRAGAC